MSQQLGGGAGSLCPRFSQNAWKKDLCSHCFKSKEEHSEEAKQSRGRFMTLYAIRTPTTPDKPPQSILKTDKSKKSSSLNVKFPEEESKVIGYGGEEFSDDEEVFEFEPDPVSTETDHSADNAEDDKDLQRLTKSNTEFNSISANLNDNADPAKKPQPQKPLMLGQIDSNKNAQSPPLLVSIKPFGSSIETNINASRKSHLNKLLDDGSTSKNTLNDAQNGNSIAVSNINGEPLKKEEVKTESSLNSNKTDTITDRITDDDKLTKTVDTPKTDSINILKSITNHIQISPVKDTDGSDKTLTEDEDSKNKVVNEENEKVNIKIALENPVPTNENRKTQITRGSVLTKNHEQVKTKRFQSPGITLKLDDISSSNKESSRLNETKENLNENLSKFNTNKTLEVSVQQKNYKNITEDSRQLSDSKTIDPKEQSGFDYISAIATLKNELMLKKIDQVLTSRPSSFAEADKVEKTRDQVLTRRPSSSVEADKVEKTRGVGVGGKEETVNEVSIVNGVGSTFKDIIEKERVIVDDKDVTLQVMKILDSEGLSREMAGEPDGRADSDDLNEMPPALPLTPPPIAEPHPRTSFLHTFSKEKPKIPAKPRVPELVASAVNKDTPSDQKPTPATPTTTFIDLNLDPSKNMKRQAPKPPPVSPTDTPTGLFQRNPSISTNPDSPVVKEREKRERANSCSPLPTPETSPRRTLSLSHDSLAGNIVEKQSYSTPEKICTKRGNKVRLTLRKILRLGSRDEDGMRVEDDHHQTPPALKPRPEIIHPLDLNKSAVQVLRNERIPTTPQPKDPTNNGSGGEMASSPPRSHGFMLTGRPSKPPPPPRSQSLDMGVRGPLPVRPPPPKTADLAKATAAAAAAQVSSEVTCVDGVYANLGEARMDVMPEKPQRAGSIRDSARNTSSKPDEVTSEKTNSGELSSGDSDNVYESIVPECDLPPERSLSLTIPYCGSETESDIYYPYTFSSSEESPEDDNDGEGWRLHGTRKGRSIVHSSLEENYGAVIVANHEALSQLLEQANNKFPTIPSSLRALRNSSNLRWTDFKLEDSCDAETIGSRIFYGAQWGDSSVTVCVNSGQARLPLAMGVIAEFNDVVPSNFVKGCGSAGDLTQVLVSVLLRQSISQLERYKWPSGSPQEVRKEAALVAVQLINCVKALQARGTEDADVGEFLLCREHKFNSLKVCLLPYDLPEAKNKSNGRVSLCQCVLNALGSLPMPSVISNLLTCLLKEEHATSLSQAKAVLEFWLWGPGDIPLTSDRQTSLQRWLDLERANVLQSLVVAMPSPPRPRFSNASDLCHLSFLVHTSAKVIAEASALFDLHGNETSGV
ncbi:hypothetical protein LSTR_LSTR001922 [Laodelphax striatellus]|uniref:Uncharacterized protein n=1 Tax=Laodelphax striatellus TaxID=195883 RepID=A0A482XI21_LAOST|nr:hypothetical protein LSTR_LSTR001922 [Laodelphax striatellus]